MNRIDLASLRDTEGEVTAIGIPAMETTLHFEAYGDVEVSVWAVNVDGVRVRIAFGHHVRITAALVGVAEIQFSGGGR